MEVIQTTIYAALCLGFIVILTGGQNRDIVKYRGENVTFVCDISVHIQFPNCQWNFTQNGGEERPLTNGTRYTWSCSQISVSPPWVRSKISFTNVTFNDSGIYTCEVMTPIAENRRQFVLTVLAKPEITVHKTNYTAASGTNVTLECIVNANGEILTSIEWWYSFNQQWIQVEKSGKYFWTIQMPSLVISNVQTWDSRLYKCVASTDLDTAKGPAILLNVQNKPTVTVKEYNYSIGEGYNLTLHCSIDWHGSTVKKVDWAKKRNSQFMHLETTPRVFWDISNPSMKINIVHLDDAGQYRCIGMTEFGTTWSSQISVQIFSTPNISIPVVGYTTINGTSTVLEVKIDDKMQTLLSVKWEKYNQENQQWFPLENNSRRLWTYSEPSLRIDTALVEDEGQYRIIAKTAYHEVRSSPITINIYVTAKIKELETRPEIIREGDTVEIRCLVDGRPEPKVSWRLANGTTSFASSLRNGHENILILERVTNLNEGNYTCIARNSFNSDESMIFLTVSDRPLLNPPNEELTGSPLEKYVVPGVSAFICVALIASIVVIILIRRKRQKGRTDKQNLGIRSTNGQKHPSPSETIGSGNNHSKFYVDPSVDMTYAQVIRKSSKNIDGSQSIMDANIPLSNTQIDGRMSIRETNITQSKTHFDGSNTNGDTDASQVYMNITNAYAAVQQHLSTSNSNSCINEETESENTQVKKTEELNYAELEFSCNTQDESSSLGIRGSPSDTTYTEVVVFSR